MAYAMYGSTSMVCVCENRICKSGNLESYFLIFFSLAAFLEMHCHAQREPSEKIFSTIFHLILNFLIVQLNSNYWSKSWPYHDFQLSCQHLNTKGGEKSLVCTPNIPPWPALTFCKWAHFVGGMGMEKCPQLRDGTHHVTSIATHGGCAPTSQFGDAFISLSTVD